MPNRFENRIENLRLKLAENNLEGLYISNPSNVSYFTGTKGEDISLWISLKEALIITDFRYREMAESVKWFKYEETSLKRSLNDILASVQAKQIAVERNSLSLAKYLDFKESISTKEIFPAGSKEEPGGLVEELRLTKDSEEIALTTKAEEIGCKAFKYILSEIRPGISEKEIALKLENYMLSHGAEALSFDTIVVSGKKTSRPHGIPDNTEIQTGDFVTMDFGCKYKGYCSDMTRTIAVGNPSDEMIHVYDIVLKAQLNACEKLKAGMKGSEAHKLASDIIVEAGYGDYFGHGLGHGTGLDIHESPRLSPSYPKIIPEDSIVSIEPGIYLSGNFGVRIEDLAIVKRNGIINLALSAPKELIII